MSDFESDRKSLIPDLTRRRVLATGLASGFALSTHPISATTAISTPAEGMTAGEISIPSGELAIPAYRAMPASSGPFPVVLVVQEIFGVHEHIKDVCRRLAKEGYLAIAMEMFVRQGDVSKLTSIDEIRPIVATVPDEQVMSDLDAAIAFARSEGKGDTARLGITGFCWGGRIAWLYAAHNPALKAGVAWYGRLAGTPTKETPQHPLDVAAGLYAPVLGLYGGDDQGIPLDTVEDMRKRLSAAGKASEIVVYPDAPHAFHADYRPSYREAPAKDGWQRMLKWFRQHGAG